MVLTCHTVKKFKDLNISGTIYRMGTIFHKRVRNFGNIHDNLPQVQALSCVIILMLWAKLVLLVDDYQGPQKHDN